MKHYQKYREMGKAFLWKKYFLQENPEDSKKNAKGMPRKQTKLESLKRWFYFKFILINKRILILEVGFKIHRILL